MQTQRRRRLETDGGSRGCSHGERAFDGLSISWDSPTREGAWVKACWGRDWRPSASGPACWDSAFRGPQRRPPESPAWRSGKGALGVPCGCGSRHSLAGAAPTRMP